MKHRPRARRTRPLLVAGALVSTMTLAGCPFPFGNLKAPNCDLGQCEPPPDLAAPDAGEPIDLGDADHD
jgi:hypothetical protein